MQRLKIVAALTFIFFGAITLKIFQKQILEHHKYADLAKGQQTVEKEIKANRGKIYVKDGTDLYPLATNLTYYAISVVPKNIKNKDETSQKLASIR